MIQRVWIVCSVVAGLAACAVLPTTGLVQIYERGTGKTGRGEVNALTKKLFATFDGRNFEGSYAVIPDSAGIEIISSHGLMNSSLGIVSGSAKLLFLSLFLKLHAVWRLESRRRRVGSMRVPRFWATGIWGLYQRSGQHMGHNHSMIFASLI